MTARQRKIEPPVTCNSGKGMKWSFTRKDEVHQLHDNKELRAQINKISVKRRADTWKLTIWRTYPSRGVAYTMHGTDIEALKQVATTATRLID